MRKLTKKSYLVGINGYFITCFGLTLFGLFSLLNGFGLSSLLIGFDFTSRAWSIVTGLIIGLCFLWQWRLHFKKVITGTAHDTDIELATHRWVGAFMIALLFVHATSMGFAIRTLLSYCLLIIVMSGLFHTQFLKKGLKFGEKTWKFLHLGVSALILPLIILHAWIALAYKG
jgi:hypothetical protein